MTYRSALTLVSSAFSIFVLAVSPSFSADDLKTVKSNHPFAITVDRLEATAKQKGFVVFARLDHAAAAASVGLSMPASTVVVIGNPKVGTERFVRTPTYAIDLPLRVLVWEDQQGIVSISFNTAPYALAINKRHGLPTDAGAETQAKRTEDAIASLVETASQ